MSETLDAAYQKELDFFRSTVREFSDRFPKIANRLTLSASGVKDPHVERLIQAFAYMNARTRLKLDDSFPELADAMLGILYPHMVAPIPSMSIVGFKLNRTQKDLTQGHLLKRHSVIESEKIQSNHCLFRSCFRFACFQWIRFRRVCCHVRFPRRLHPDATMPNLSCVLNLRLSILPNRLRNLHWTNLRFYISIPNFEKAARLLELVLTQTLEVVVSGSGWIDLHGLPPTAINARGIRGGRRHSAPDESVISRLPTPDRVFRTATEVPVLRFDGTERCSIEVRRQQN